MSRKVKAIITGLVLTGTLSGVVALVASQYGCGGAPGLPIGGASCEQMAQDYMSKFTEITALMPPQSEEDIERMRTLLCEAVDIADQLLSQGCGQADPATLAQAQQMLDQMSLQCN